MNYPCPRCPATFLPLQKGAFLLLLLLGTALSPVFAARALDPAETSSLTRIRIQQLMDTVEIRRGDDGRWWVVGREVPARANMALQTIRQLEALEETNPQTLSLEQDLIDNGLQLVAARFVRLTFSDGRIQWLRLGELASNRDTVTWARDAGNPLRAETPAPTIAYRTTGIPVSADIDSWTSPILIQEIHAENLDTLQVTWRHQEDGPAIRYTLARAGDSVLLTDPDGPPRLANPRKAREALGQAVSLVIDGFRAPGEIIPPASWEPRVTVRIVFRNGATYDLKAVSSDARFDYVPHPEAPKVLVKLFRRRLDAFRHTPAYIATSYPYGPELDDGISGPPPPGFAIYAPHGYQHEYLERLSREEREKLGEHGEHDHHDSHDHHEGPRTSTPGEGQGDASDHAEHPPHP